MPNFGNYTRNEMNYILKTIYQTVILYVKNQRD